MKKMNYTYFQSPVGRLLLNGEQCLESICFPNSKRRVEPDENWIENREFFNPVIDQLDAYFNGHLTQFHLKMDLKGSDFQIKVWKELEKIPYGETISYGELAKKIGNPKASRAVGMANGKNPIPIVIPCHRVIGKDGSLTGFGGGLDVKQALLKMEQD